jgi:hypothetical protein
MPLETDQGFLERAGRKEFFKGARVDEPVRAPGRVAFPHSPVPGESVGEGSKTYRWHLGGS